MELKDMAYLLSDSQKRALAWQLVQAGKKLSRQQNDLLPLNIASEAAKELVGSDLAVDRQDALDYYYQTMELALSNFVDSNNSIKLQEVAVQLRHKWGLTEGEVDSGRVFEQKAQKVNSDLNS